ncbi:Uncharacterized protein YuzB, UPF0349 family [Clostridium cavendishii DSM 21758]|uniref:Uncharacterized protein YuzB, UPF0349 family n=1 Tax=Clostridium cavendishii DSM 21758 TaxID=1121302 RepID=A0A1M6MPL2_9CLOT|nr:DUF1450 domain-containing protein [Clostridium cavendishii]SHJ85445.1 Uncharacterized protein YuzB, UPF0349 family [Clostridium cavendishii DSM 21758]
MSEILFCSNSLGVEEDEVIEKLKLTLPDSAIDVYGCLGHCSCCGDTPYVLVDKNYIEAETHEELIKKIVVATK